MEHLLRFNSNIHMLSGEEFGNLISSIDKDYVIKILFQYFNFSLQSCNSLSTINETIIPQIKSLNNKIGNIIQRRPESSEKSEKTDRPTHQSITLNRLPYIQISIISSFLELKDILCFEKCSKSIFIGSRSPNTLNELPLYSSKIIWYQPKIHGSIFHWNRFQNVQKICVDIEQCMSYNSDSDRDENEYDFYEYENEISNIPINPRSLTLLNHGDPDHLYGFENMETLFQHISHWNLNNIEVLNTHSIAFTKPIFPVLKLKYLSVHNDWRTGNNVPLPNELRGYVVAEGDTLSAGDISEYIESLHLSEYKSLAQQKRSLKNLKEICFCDPSLEELQWINCQKLGNLQRINIRFFDWNNNEINKEKRKQFLSLFMESSINYVSIHAKNQMVDMISILNEAMTNNTKHTLKIKLLCSGDKVNWSMEELNDAMLKMINTLKKQTINFMVLGKISIYMSREMVKIDIGKMKGLVFKSVFFERNCHEFMTQNEQCNINGYKEKWIMKCWRCEKCYDDITFKYNQLYI